MRQGENKPGLGTVYRTVTEENLLPCYVPFITVEEACCPKRTVEAAYPPLVFVCWQYSIPYE